MTESKTHQREVVEVTRQLTASQALVVESLRLHGVSGLRLATVGVALTDVQVEREVAMRHATTIGSDLDAARAEFEILRVDLQSARAELETLTTGRVRRWRRAMRVRQH